VSDQVLSILFNSIAVEGNQLRIVRELDRRDYVAVNGVLEAIGGKWNRKAKAHLFPIAAADALDPVLLTQTYSAPADYGFFETPTRNRRRLGAVPPHPAATEEKNMKVYLVEAEHWNVPGRQVSVHATDASANEAAARLVNDMLADMRKRFGDGDTAIDVDYENLDIPADATPEDWNEAEQWLEDAHGAAHCYVAVTDHEVQGLPVNPTPE
jgi:hypothetical protein